MTAYIECLVPGLLWRWEVRCAVRNTLLKCGCARTKAEADKAAASILA